MRRKHWWIVALAVAVAMAAVAGGIAAFRTGDNTGRQAEIAAKGRQVMPFDLERTTHRFTKTAKGGVQTVVADDPADATQIGLIRDHLEDENARFGRGDFGDPATIHGTQMPGLAKLSAGYQRVTTDYTTLPDGGRITYRTKDPDLIEALHAWFDAQVSDHGSHAENG